MSVFNMLGAVLCLDPQAAGLVCSKQSELASS